MTIRRTTASGHDALLLVSTLLQRVRLVDPLAGMWEAADVQWWWRRPRESDDLEQHFWVDDDGPVAGVWLTSWGADLWNCDPILVPGATGPALDIVWAQAREQVGRHASGKVVVPVPSTDPALEALALTADMVVGSRDHTAWLDIDERQAARSPAPGYRIVDRTGRAGSPHPMRPRNGDDVAERLGVCPLYDPALDLAVETADGGVAGYVLCWSDPVTGVGLVEPVRVEDDHQRRGLATAMVSEGVERLAAAGARRVKIGFGTEAAGAVYTGVGFKPTSTAAWFEAPVSALRTSA
ncbi:GNAT family N-acetyltransferase [Nocardioides sp.]|uniref:GNAT family N-acetyltransferase n=1 Tax=Nocardioides sp. TaxID=35761 RepID=UPI00286BD7C5|nr:GNAT family N-acetyltransferase [Nocardioides sp.]